MLKEEIYQLLDSKIVGFFPAVGNWKSSCYDKPTKIKEDYFPCHTRDDNWLTLMLQEKFNIFYLPYSFLNEYIKTSKEFDIQRKAYEQRIVLWQIWWMLSDGENWILDPKYGSEMFMFGPECDLAFRKGIVDTLSAIGMPLDAIEKGIEENVNHWRKYYIDRAFENVYGRPLFNLGKKLELSPIDPEFKEKWKDVRLYEYYQEHKESVDKYGEVLPCMLMSEEEVAKIRKYLEIKGQERIEEIKTAKEKVRYVKDDLPFIDDSIKSTEEDSSSSKDKIIQKKFGMLK